MRKQDKLGVKVPEDNDNFGFGGPVTKEDQLKIMADLQSQTHSMVDELFSAITENRNPFDSDKK